MYWVWPQEIWGQQRGEAKEGFTAGYELRARYTLFAEVPWLVNG